MTASKQAHDAAKAMGARAGAATRETGVPAVSPFDKPATKDLHRSWSAGYVRAGYRRGGR